MQEQMDRASVPAPALTTLVFIREATARLANSVRGLLVAPFGLEDIRVGSSSWHEGCHSEL